METINVYSPLQDLSIICGDYTILVNAINRALELAENETHSYGSIRKTISIKTITDSFSQRIKYIDADFKWDEFEVASMLYKHFDVIKKLYEHQGWKVTTSYNTLYEFGNFPTDELIFEF